jgi:hypothetical protein
MTQELEMLLDEFDAAVSFWNTEEGLLERIGLLGDQIQFGTYNHALKVIATSVAQLIFGLLVHQVSVRGVRCMWGWFIIGVSSLRSFLNILTARIILRLSVQAQNQ